MEHKKKVGIITFHAAHNYGAMLQAYALQQTVIDLGYDCEIINFRTQKQIDQYKPFYRQNGLKEKLKALLYPSVAIASHYRYKKFEAFLQNNLHLSPSQYATLAELSDASLDYDAYISGSDQIWNPSLGDYDDAYLLPFVKKGRRISYAPSLGRSTHQLNQSENPIFKDCIPKFDSLSVREEASARVLNKICGYPVQVTLDPTLLLEVDAWNQLSGETPLVKGDYIFFYTPFIDIEFYNEAIQLAVNLGMKIIIPMSDWYSKFHSNSNVEYFINSGPREFLNLVKYSKMVIGTSFHVVAFSIIYGKQFYAINGQKDTRITNLLSKLSLTMFASRPNSVLNDNELYSIYKNANDKLNKLTIESKEFLRKSLLP